MPLAVGVALALGMTLAPPPPRLPPGASEGAPPSAAAVRGEQQARAAASADANATSPDGLGLSAQADGGFLYVDPGKRFKARIARDGAVTFADRWRRPAKRRRGRKRERGTCCGIPADGLFPAINVFLGAPVSGPTEWAFAARGHDPNAAAKAGFLARTAQLRTGLAKDAMRSDMRVALDRLEDGLQRLWADPDLALERKRAIVFARWDALADEAPAASDTSAMSELDRLRASYGERARRRIASFIRRTLPADSPHAFTPSELTAFNRERKSQATFAPYRLPPRAAPAKRAPPPSEPPPEARP